MADFNDMVQGLMNAGVAVVGSVLNEVPAEEEQEGEVSSVLPAPLRAGCAERASALVPWLIALAGYRGDVPAGLLVGGEQHLAVRRPCARGDRPRGRASGCSGRLRHADRRSAERSRRRWLGWLVFGFGLLVYFVGRMFSISIFEFGSQIFVIAGGLLLLKGRRRCGSPGSRSSI